MPGDKIKILLIEDDPDEVFLIREMLTETDGARFHVDSVGRLQAGLDHLGNGGIDAVLLDLSLPDSHGLETFVEAHKKFPHVPIIVLTALADDTIGVRAVQEGAQDYLVKAHVNKVLLMRAIRYAIERNIAQETSREALAHLRELTEAKSQFVAEASHELRTPLGIIREFVSLVYDEVAGPVTRKQKECLQSALRNCDRLTELINKMLDLAKIEAGRTEIDRKRIDIIPLLTECHNDFLPKCQSKKQRFLLEVRDGLPAAHCDASSIREVLINLLGNAHKFTPEEGTIRLGCRQEGKFLCTYIDDTGPGIEPEAQQKIFEPFAQVGRQDGPGAKGTGLGLSIAKNLVTLNKGYISVDSAPGMGSRFSFTLPIYDKEAPHRVLVVDDEEAVLKYITRVLQSSDLNLEVKSTESGLDSLVIAGQFNPNLIILDVHLSEVGGEQVLASLKQKMPLDSGKVLLISGDVDSLKKLDEQGADDYLCKPFTSHDLIRKTISLLRIERREE